MVHKKEQKIVSLKMLFSAFCIDIFNYNLKQKAFAFVSF